MRALPKSLALTLCTTLALTTTTACDLVPEPPTKDQTQQSNQSPAEDKKADPQATQNPAQEAQSPTGKLSLRIATPDEKQLKEVKTLAEKAEITIDELAVRRCIPADPNSDALKERTGDKLEPLPEPPKPGDNSEPPPEPPNPPNLGDKFEPEPKPPEPPPEPKPGDKLEPPPEPKPDDKLEPKPPVEPPPGAFDHLSEEELERLLKEKLPTLDEKQLKELADKHRDKLSDEQLDHLLDRLEDLQDYREKIEEHEEEIKEHHEEMAQARKELFEKLKEKEHELNDEKDAPDACAKSEWIALNPEPIKLDLLNLDAADAQSLLGAKELPEGSYRGIRVRISQAQIVVGGMKIPLKIPEKASSGVQIQHSFEIEPKGKVELDLGFDALRAPGETQTDEWMLLPFLRPSDD